MQNIGYADNYWGRNPRCYYYDSSDSQSSKIEDDYQSGGYEKMIALMKESLDEDEFAECQQDLDAWARLWFSENADYSQSAIKEWVEDYCDFSGIDC